MNIENKQHRSWLFAFVSEMKAGAYLHHKIPLRRRIAVRLAWAANAGIGKAFRSGEHSFDAIIRCDVDLD